MRCLPLLLTLACAPPELESSDPADTDLDSDTDIDTDSDSDSDADTDTDTDNDPVLPCDAVPSFADGLTPIRELHVAEDGSDATGDGSRDAPFASVDRASREATPGTAIRIHPGRYGRMNVNDLAGTFDAPIWIGGLPGEDKPLLTQASEGLHLTRVRHVVVHDIEVADTTANGINIDDGGAYDDPEATRWVLVERVDVHDVGGSGNQDCLKMSGVYDFVVRDSSFARCGGGISGSGVDQVGCHRGVIARSRFTDTSGSGVQLKGGTSDVEVRWIVFERPGQRGVNMGGSTGKAFFRPPLDPDGDNAEARGVRVRGNLFIGGVSPIAFVGCDTCRATHNTFLRPERWVVRILQETNSDETHTFVPSRNGVLTNNLAVVDRGTLTRWINVGAGTDPDSFTWRHELWFATDAPDDLPSLPGTTEGLILGVDPLVDEEGVPGVGSPALGAGVRTGLLGDRLGNCYEDPPTVGSVSPGR